MTKTTDALLRFYVPDASVGRSLPSRDQVLTTPSSRSKVLLQTCNILSLTGGTKSSTIKAITVVRRTLLSTNEQRFSQVSSGRTASMATGTMCIANAHAGSCKGTPIGRSIGVEGTQRCYPSTIVPF